MVKAAVFLGNETIEIREFPKPKVAQDCALLKIAACGICGTDPHIYKGHLKVPAPIVLGHEFSGVIEEMGTDFPRVDMLGKELKAGDRVALGTTMNCGKCYFCRFTPHRNNLCTNCDIYGITMGINKSPSIFGGYSEYIYLLPGSWLFKIDDNMSFEEAALADPCACATRVVERAFSPGMPSSNDSLGIGKSVVVQGLGTIGLLSAACAKACGAYPVIGIESNPIRIAHAKTFGCDVVIDMNEYKTALERTSKVKELTGGLGGDVVFEMAGVPAAFSESLMLVRAGGKVIEFGHFSNVGTTPLNPQDIVNKDLDIHGVFAYPNSQIGIALNMLQHTKDRFPYKTLITHRFSVEQAEDAIRIGSEKSCVKAMIINPV